MELTYSDLERIEKLLTPPPSTQGYANGDWAQEFEADVPKLCAAIRELDEMVTTLKAQVAAQDESLEEADAIFDLLNTYVDEGHDALDQLTPTPPREVADAAGELQHMTFAGRVKYFASALIAEGKMAAPVIEEVVAPGPFAPSPDQAPEASEWAELFSPPPDEESSDSSDDSLTPSPPPTEVMTETEQVRAARNSVSMVLDQVDELDPDEQAKFWADVPESQRPFVEMVRDERALLKALGENLGAEHTKINFVDPNDPESDQNYTYDIPTGRVEAYSPE